MKLRVALVAVAVVAMAGVASANLLLNGGFNANGGEGTTPTDWTGTGKEGVRPWGSHDGDGWLMAFHQWGVGAGTYGELYQDVASGAGWDYTLNFWQEGDNSWSGTAFSVSLLWLDTAGSQLGAATMDLQSWALVNNGWTNHILQATSPLNTATVRVQFAATTLDNAQGAAKVDQIDFTVAAIPEPTTLGLLGLCIGILALRRSRMR